MKKITRKFIQGILTISLIAQTTMLGGNYSVFATQMDKADMEDDGTTFFSVSEPGTSRDILFNEDWKFYLGDNSGAQRKDFDDSKWRKLDLPHDWSIEFDFDMDSPSRSEGGYLNGGTGWYRKTFVLPEYMADKRVSINFGGVYMDSTTYVNGEYVGNYPNGYTPFSYDITDLVVADGVTENVIAVKAINRQPSSRWYSGSGIYRNVDLVVTDQVHVERYGTFITTPNIEEEYPNGNVTVNVKTDVVNKTDIDQNIRVRSTIFNLDGEKLGQTETSAETVVESNLSAAIEQNIIAPNPELWSIENPNMYKMLTEIEVEGVVKDAYETRFGFRYFEMDSNTGFSLNGEWMKLKGVCMHHDQGALGAVANRRAIERQMQILKDMGTNAIRVSHNPAANELIEICEDMGLLVIDEAFDTWYGGKKTYDAGRFFEKIATHPEATPGMTWAEFDLKQMVDRGKNSPAIIMWSLGNEIGEANSGGAKPVETIKNLVKWTKEIDPTRLTTMGFDAFRFNDTGEGGHENVAKELDAVGFNYAEHTYDSRHEVWPEWLMYGSETSSATKSRGVYAHPDNEGEHDSGAHPDFQQSSYGNDRVRWGKTAINSWIPDRDKQFIAGQFIWTGFDYIGEPTPWHNSNQPPKNSYFGIIDTAGFPKDDYYFYQSQWTSVDDNPMVHILPHWNWEDKSLASKVTVDGKIPVRVYSNAKKVELFKDGESLGAKQFESMKTSYDVPYQETADGKLYLEWRLPYESGKLEAVAMDESGSVLARDIITTAGVPAGVKLTADRDIINADGDDLSYITVDIVDKDGNFVPTADNLVNFNITGNGKIVGVDNGNSLTHERYKDTKRKAFSGKALVIVQSTPNAGSFTLTATSSGLTADRISVFTTEDNQDEKIILGYKIPNILTNIGVMPTLPAQIEAVYSDSTTQMMDVSWDAIEEELLGKPGVVKVGGTVSENEDKVQIEITVTGIIGIKETKVVTAVGQIPTMPPTVQVVYSDASMSEKSVTWEGEITEKDVERVGSFEREGTVEGVPGFPAKASIRVTDEVEYSKNIAVFNSIEEGYPKATASHEGGDKVANIIDGSSVFEKRWTNWANGYGRQETEWVALEFEKEYEIGKIGINFFTDGQTKAPAKLIVETSRDGEDWTPVDEQSQTENFEVAQGDVAKKFDIAFTPVLMKHIRLKLTGQPVDDKFRPIGLTEVYVYTGVVTPGSGIAELTELNLNGDCIDGFESDQYAYTKELGYDENIPTVTAVAKDNGTIFVIPALTKDSSTIVEVTSEDGKVARVYTIEFMAQPPKLISSEISLESNSITEDDIVGVNLINTLEDGSVIDNKLAIIEYDIISDDGGKIEIIDHEIYAYSKGAVKIIANVTYDEVTVTSNVLNITIAPNTEEKVVISYDAVSVLTEKGVAPNLPEKVRATFDKGLPQEVPVAWDAIDAKSYENYGEFIVRGTVEGQNLAPTAKVIVKGAIAVQKFSAATPVGVVPKLPENATVYFSDTTFEKLPVIWESHTAADFNAVGNTTLTGTIEGTKLDTTITVRVSEDTIKSENVAKQWTGSTLPSGIASFTNRGNQSLDLVTYINDTVISFNDSPQNRWTNWQSAKRPEDWVGIIFAKGGDMSTQFVDNMRIGFFQDSGTSAPADLEIQYYVPKLAPPFPDNVNMVENEKSNPLNLESNWADVTGFVQEDEILPVGRMTEFKFDMVETYAIRAKMTGKPNMGIAITEMEAYGKEVTQNPTFDVTSIKLDGVDIEDFDEDILSYNIELTDNQVPTVTVEATNNASVTVVPANDANGRTKLIVTAENGIATKTYTLNFAHIGLGSDHVKLTGKDSVTSGEEFHVTLGLHDMEKPVYSQDVILDYDSKIFTFEGIEEIGDSKIMPEGIEDNKELGIIRVLGVVLDGKGLIGDADLFKFNFIANETEADTSSTVSAKVEVATVEGDKATVLDLGTVQKAIWIEGNEDSKEPEIGDNTELIAAISQARELANNAIIGTKPGNYPQSAVDALLTAIENAQEVADDKATQSEIDRELGILKREIAIFRASIIKEAEDVEGDVNEDGRVDIADLALVASHYRETSNDGNWSSAKKVDMNKDDKIDIEDLVYVAKRILNSK